MPPKGQALHVFRPKNKKRAKKDDKDQAPDKDKVSDQVQNGNSRCALLQLPPELRNRIYHFAEETCFSADFNELPLLRMADSKIPNRKNTNGGRQYLSLAHTCKQIREEFRPLWLRDSAVRLELENVEPFLATYYPIRAEYQNAPKLLLISWHHDEADDVLFDITPLLRLRAACPTSVANFKCRAMIEGDLPNAECWECGHSIHCGCDDADCDHEEAIDDAYCQQAFEYQYTQTLDNFLANANESWLQAIRDDVHDVMKVECSVELHEQYLTFHIRFEKGKAPAGFTKANMYKDAGRYLQKMGMFDLDVHGELDFVLGEATGKCPRHGEDCGYPIPTYNQVVLVNPVATAKAKAKSRAAAKAASSTSTSTPGPAPEPTSTSSTT